MNDIPIKPVEGLTFGISIKEEYGFQPMRLVTDHHQGAQQTPKESVLVLRPEMLHGKQSKNLSKPLFHSSKRMIRLNIHLLKSKTKSGSKTPGLKNLLRGIATRLRRFFKKTI